MHSQAKLQLNLCWGDDQSDDLEINIKENQSGMEEKFSSRASISDNEAIQNKNAQLKLVSTFVHLVNKLRRVILSHAIRVFVKTNNRQQKYL